LPHLWQQAERPNPFAPGHVLQHPTDSPASSAAGHDLLALDGWAASGATSGELSLSSASARWSATYGQMTSGASRTAVAAFPAGSFGNFRLIAPIALTGTDLSSERGRSDP
jgi:hypothetical protein